MAENIVCKSCGYSAPREIAPRDKLCYDRECCDMRWENNAVVRIKTLETALGSIVKFIDDYENYVVETLPGAMESVRNAAKEALDGNV